MYVCVCARARVCGVGSGGGLLLWLLWLFFCFFLSFSIFLIQAVKKQKQKFVFILNKTKTMQDIPVEHLAEAGTLLVMK